MLQARHEGRFPGEACERFGVELFRRRDLDRDVVLHHAVPRQDYRTHAAAPDYADDRIRMLKLADVDFGGAR